MKCVYALAMLGGLSYLVAGCKPVQSTADLDQSVVCEVKDTSLESTNAVCSPGQRILFLPARFGNAQLPVLFASLHCDHRYSIAITEGAVSCIYQPVTKAVD